MNYNAIRRKSREVTVGSLKIGGNSPIAVQSMTNTDTHDIEATERQIRALAAAGCDIVRLTVPDMNAVDTITALRERGVGTPLVADIHFDYRIAVACAEAGVDKIRINPGNIGDAGRVEKVCDACTQRHIPIRIGVNSGSLEKHLLEKYGKPCPEALVDSAMYHAGMLEKCGFRDIVISIKASNVYDMVKANTMLAQMTDYPLHLGVTEAGAERIGAMKSAAGIGALLTAGIGDTIRVSLTADPLREVAAAKDILRALEVEGQCGMDIVSCPTCGRTKINLIELVERFEAAVRSEGLEDFPVKVAIMGCVVNGPGEAREADVGVAGGIGEAVLIKHGKTDRKIPEDKIVETLIHEIKAMKQQRSAALK